MVRIRLAERSEIEWINLCYDDVEFVHSNFYKEVIAIAEVNNQKAGLGRLVTIDEKNLKRQLQNSFASKIALLKPFAFILLGQPARGWPRRTNHGSFAATRWLASKSSIFRGKAVLLAAS